MINKIPKRISTAIMNSLKGGVVPRIGLGHIAVGREDEINALLKDVEIIQDGGSTFRFIVGKFGSGKSFLLQTIRTYVLDKGFVVIDADLSPERRLVGNNNQGLATYKELIKNISTKTKPDGGALSLIIDKWLLSIQNKIISEKNILPDSENFYNEMKKEIYLVTSQIEDLVNGFDFAKLLIKYWEATINSDSETKSNILKWLRGEYTTKTDAKKELGISIIISDDNWYEYIKLITRFVVLAGYKGMLMLIDELINIYKIPNQISRQYNYEKILTLYNDTLQGKSAYLGIIMCGTPTSIEDTRRGVFSYEALKSRLEDSRFANDSVRDLMAPIIRLKPLTIEEMFVLMDRLSDIHAQLYEYDRKLKTDDIQLFLTAEYNRMGANKQITPREIIRDFIEILNTLFQYPEKDIEDLLNFKEEEIITINLEDDIDEFSELDF